MFLHFRFLIRWWYIYLLILNLVTKITVADKDTLPIIVGINQPQQFSLLYWNITTTFREVTHWNTLFYWVCNSSINIYNDTVEYMQCSLFDYYALSRWNYFYTNPSSFASYTLTKRYITKPFRPPDSVWRRGEVTQITHRYFQSIVLYLEYKRYKVNTHITQSL